MGPEKAEVQNVDMARPRSTALRMSASEPACAVCPPFYNSKSFSANEVFLCLWA